MRIIHLGLGVQYYFSSKHILLPYAGIEVDYNFIWGFYEQVPRIVPGNEGLHKTTFDIVPVSRVGIGIDAGIDYRISQNLGFNFGAKFKIANLFGKSSQKTNPASLTPDDKNKIPLLDQAATGLNTNLTSSRNLSYFELYLGFSVFAGRR